MLPLAAINKIPSIFIYTNELVSLKNNFNSPEKFAKEFGLEPINIIKLTDDELEKFYYSIQLNIMNM